MTGTSPAPPGRIGRAARTFGVPPEQVVDAACLFAGRTPPIGAGAQSLLTRVLERLDQVPVGVLATVVDLSDAAEDEHPGQQIPPLPEPILDAVAFLDVLLARLSPRELRAAALDVALDRVTALRAALLAESADGAVPEEEDLEGQIAVLETSDPDRWGARRDSRPAPCAAAASGRDRRRCAARERVAARPVGLAAPR